MTKRVTIAMITAAVLSSGVAATLIVQNKLQNRPSVNLGTVTKINGCVVSNGLPDTFCTPGSFFKSVSKSQVCIPGYSFLVRHVNDQTKKQVLNRYGINISKNDEYEIDHLVSLQLGGSNDIANLWPEAANPLPGFHQKDAVENLLHSEVCKGKITLQQAQNQISTNWKKSLN